MLIDDLEYFKRKSNYHNKFSGLDTPGRSISSSRDFKEYPIQDFDYQFNSWGFRGPEYEQYIGKPVNICLGDSFTVNVGGPVEHSWCSQLAKHFTIPTLNLGMDGAGNDAIKLVYTRACKLFNVQNTFVVYSYLHRRLIDKEFTQGVLSNNENFEYFLEHRILNAIECALPSWCWTQEEKQFLRQYNTIISFNKLLQFIKLRKQKIYFLDMPYVSLFKDYQTMDRKFIVKDVYERLLGPDWPTVDQFVKGADPHADMFTKNFGRFVSTKIYINRDGHHLNFEANEIYANYLYQQWKQNNES